MFERGASPAATGTVLLDTYGFRLPCRSFYVRVNVTRDRRLPVVDEHVLRLVRVCASISLGRLRLFFGLSASEAEIVVDDLVARGLLAVTGDDIRLSKSAADLFTIHPDEEPRLISVESWTEHVWIDLVSRGIVARPTSRAPSNLLEVALPPGSTMDLSVDLAHSAFEENFPNYARTVKRLPDPDRVSIHSMASVEPDRWGTVVVLARKVMDPGAATSRFELASLDAAAEAGTSAGPRLRRLAETLSNQFAKLALPRPTVASIDHFERLVGRPIGPRDRGNGCLDFDAWRSNVAGDAETAARWTVGASYLEENVTRLANTVKPLGKGRSSLIWLRPGGDAWGATEDLGRALAQLRRIVGLPDHPRGKGATLLFPAAVRDIKRFRALFEQGSEAAPRVGANLEIVLLRGVAALVTASVPINDGFAVPVGCIVTEAAALARVEAFLSTLGKTAWSIASPSPATSPSPKTPPAPPRPLEAPLVSSEVRVPGNKMPFGRT